MRGVNTWIVWAVVAFALVAVGGNQAATQMSIEEYDFQLVQDSVRQGDDITLSVRLVHMQSGKPVPDAVIFARRMDMEPDGMPTMTADLAPEPSEESGVYRFRTSLAMEGAWRLSLAAKVQGVTGTLQKRLVLKAQN
jgi:hypothetical protein